MIYSIEQLYQFFKIMKPNYFAVYNDKGSKVLSTAHVEGLETEKDSKKVDNSEKLWELFNLWVIGDINQGYHGLATGKYKLDLRPNETSGKSANHYWFGVGEWETSSQKVGSVLPQNNMASMGNGGNMMVLFFQSMQQQNQAMLQMMQQSFQNAQDLNRQIWEKEKELYITKNKEKAGFMDKVGNALEKHLPVIVNGLTNQKAQAIGKVVAPNGATVPTQPQAATPSVSEQENTDEKIQRIQRINAILMQVQEKYPDNDPLDMLEIGVSSFFTQQENTDNE